MKKTIIASAIAATVLSTSAYSMETASELAAMLESMPSVYGNIQLAWKHTDSDVAGESGTSGLADNGSTIGFKHSHQINDDLKASLKIEFDGFGADDKANSAGRLRLDEAHITLAGSFGEVIIGSEDSVFEKNVSSINNYWEVYSSTNSEYSTGEGDLVQYSSNSMGGFKVFAAVELDASSTETPFQLGVAYSVDALTLALAYDSNDGDNAEAVAATAFAAATPTSFEVAATPGKAAVEAEGSIGLHASYNMDNLKLVGEFETTDDVSDVFSFLGVYTVGANQYALGLSQTDFENDDEETIVTLQALHNLSGNTYVYATAKFTNEDTGATDEDTNEVAVGVTYYF